MAHIREVMAVGVPSALARMLGSNRVQTVNAGGSSQEDAIPLTVNFALIATGVTGSGVRLGPASGAALTALHNTGPAVANLWPGEDDAFNDQGPNLAVALAPGQTALAVPSIDRWIVAIEGTDAGGGIPEAPSDNNTYGRRNSAWTPALALAGGTMVGALVLASDPTAPAQAATKNYADALAALGAPLNSPVFTGQPRGTQAPTNDNSTWLATTSYVQAQGFLSQIVLGGDLAGTGGAALNGTVTGLQGRPVATTAPANGQVLAWSGANNNWAPAPAPPAAAGGATGQLQYNNAGALAGLTMSGDASLNTATGALTLAAVNSNIGTFQGLTIDAKGRVTAASNMSYGSVTSITAGAGLTGGTITGAGTIALSTPVSVANGGTGLAGGASGGVPYYSAGGTMASSAALAANALVVGGGAGAAPSTSASWTLSGVQLRGNQNASSVFPPLVAAPSLAVYGADGGNIGISILANLNAVTTVAGRMMFVANSGTMAAPAAMAAGAPLGQVWWGGYNGSSWGASAAQIMAAATSAWSASANPAYLSFITTQLLSNIEQMRLNAGLLLPAVVAGGDMGAGTINVSGGYYVGGVQHLALANPGTSGGIPYYSGTATLASSAALAANALVVGGGAGAAPATRPQWTLAASGSPLIANFNAAAAPTPAVAGLQVVSSDAGLVPGVQANAFATAAQFRMARADGTGAAPTPVVANDILGDVFLTAYNGTGAYVRAGIWRMIAAENWTATANGTSAQVITTPIGTTTTVTNQFHANGSLLMPTNVAGGDTGAGTINVSGGYYIGGALVSDPNWTFNANHSQIGNLSGGAANAPIGQNGLQIVGASAAPAGVQVNAFGGLGTLYLGRADGTPAAPTALALNDQIGAAYFYGYDGAAYQMTAAITAEARQAYTGSARGTSISFWGTPSNSTAITSMMTVGQGGLGGVAIPGTVAGSDMGAGTVNVSGGYYRGGVNVTLGQQPANNTYPGTVPTAIGTTTFSMLGLGLLFTPNATGRVLVILRGTVTQTATAAIHVRLYYGTGTAPANGAAVTGTFTNADMQVSIAAGSQVPCTVAAVFAGLTIGTQYWFDGAVSASTGTGNFFNVGFSIIEL